MPTGPVRMRELRRNSVAPILKGRSGQLTRAGFDRRFTPARPTGGRESEVNASEHRHSQLCRAFASTSALGGLRCRMTVGFPGRPWARAPLAEAQRKWTDRRSRRASVSPNEGEPSGQEGASWSGRLLARRARDLLGTRLARSLRIGRERDPEEGVRRYRRDGEHGAIRTFDEEAIAIEGKRDLLSGEECQAAGRSIVDPLAEAAAAEKCGSSIYGRELGDDGRDQTDASVRAAQQIEPTYSPRIEANAEARRAEAHCEARIVRQDPGDVQHPRRGPDPFTDLDEASDCESWGEPGKRPGGDAECHLEASRERRW